jgi:hypothetical protein
MQKGINLWCEPDREQQTVFHMAGTSIKHILGLREVKFQGIEHHCSSVSNKILHLLLELVSILQTEVKGTPLGKV